MSGKVLIVDGLATNRIVLKVKLSSAYYDVLQAATSADALALAATEAPDLVLCAPILPDATGRDLVRRIKARFGSDAPPVILFLHDNAPETRLAALQAGAHDILVKPVDDIELLARLRSVLRQHQSDRDLRVHAGPASALGFGEAAAAFRPAARIGLIAPGGSVAPMRAASLGRLYNATVTPLDPESALLSSRRGDPPDLYLLQVSRRGQAEAFDLIAKLRAAPHSRHRPIIALLSADAAGLAAGLLDMGAEGVVGEATDPAEIALRLARHLDGARHAETLREQLRNGLRAAVIDPLTGLHNRRYALPFLARLNDTAQRDGRSFAVMVADLDHFKRINDRHGHAAGDAVLRQVARLLKSNLRDEDMIARIGGEEFLMVLPDVLRDTALRTARRLCTVIRNSPFQVPSTEAPVQVTISIGVTLACPRPGTPPAGVDSLIDAADRALYDSKSCGRNMVTVCGQSAA